MLFSNMINSLQLTSEGVLLGAENQDAEPGARLTCHLLLRLLDESTDFMSYDHSSALKFPFRMSPDHHLLSAAHESIRFGPLLAVFKAMLKLSEAGTTSVIRAVTSLSNLKISYLFTAMYTCNILYV